MQNDKNQIINKQDISLKGRKELEISGVKKIESLNSEEFIIDTILGILIVRGEELTMQQLDIEKGMLWITGSVCSLEYLDKEQNKEKKGFFKKIFK